MFGCNASQHLLETHGHVVFLQSWNLEGSELTILRIWHDSKTVRNLLWVFEKQSKSWSPTRTYCGQAQSTSQDLGSSYAKQWETGQGFRLSPMQGAWHLEGVEVRCSKQDWCEPSSSQQWHLWNSDFLFRTREVSGCFLSSETLGGESH